MMSIRLKTIFSLLILSSNFIANVKAVAPTEEAVAKWKAEGTYEQKVAGWKEFKAMGGCAPSEHSVFDKSKFGANMAAGAVVDTASILVILVDFNDHVYTGTTHGQSAAVAGTPQQFDSILFSNRDTDPVFNPTGSMTDFYLENSYGNFYIIGQVTNWLRMPQTYAYYVGTNNGLPPGGNGDELARDAVLAANAGYNFQNYDNDNDGVIDGLVVIHAGHGAETGYYGIWSHKFVLPATLFPDGIEVSDYTMNPEEFGNSISPIGVICHEFGHSLGLPDLYDVTDTNNTSHGLGRWSIMATGTYNGNAQRPAHFDAWCKNQIGFLNLTTVTTNLNSVALPAAAFSPVAYKLQNATSSPEYWIVENRQKMGFDFSLPGQGLLIYHVDPTQPNNDDVNRYLVALEQADGNYDLENTAGDDGDAGDPYPGNTVNREFHDLSVPSDVVNFNSSVYPHIGVWEISNSDSIMFADLDVSWSRPYIVNDSIRFSDAMPGGNNDGNLDPGEQIRVFLTARNLMRTGFNARAQLATSNPDVNITTNNVLFDATFDAAAANNNSVPIVFTLDDSTQTTLDSFYLTIRCDSLIGVPGIGLNYSKTFGFEIALGTPRILIVDDDQGDGYEEVIARVLNRNKNINNVWHVNTQGTPPIGVLQNYPIVFWHTGIDSGNVITAGEIAVMKAYMDLGNNLLLSTWRGVRDIHLVDSLFLRNYFKADYDTTTSLNQLRGIVGTELGDGARYACPPAGEFTGNRQTLTPYTGGEAFLGYTAGGTPVCGVSYKGTYRSVLISSPIENIRDSSGFDTKDTLFNRVLAFFDDFSTGIGDGPLDNLPKSFVLEQNYPNPFNPSTTISYSIHSRGSSERPNRTVLEIYNLLGQRVKTLVDEEQSPGLYSIEWAGDNYAEKKVASGIYFYRLVLGGESQTKKMMMVK